MTSIHGEDTNRMAVYWLTLVKVGSAGITICYSVWGPNNCWQKAFQFRLNQKHHFEITQVRNSDGVFTYNIKFDGSYTEAFINGSPQTHQSVNIYLGGRLKGGSFASYGQLLNLNIMDLNPTGTTYAHYFGAST